MSNETGLRRQSLPCSTWLVGLKQIPQVHQGEGKYTVFYLLGEKKIALLLLSEAQDNFCLTYCLIDYREKSISSFLP